MRRSSSVRGAAIALPFQFEISAVRRLFGSPNSRNNSIVAGSIPIVGSVLTYSTPAGLRLDLIRVLAELAQQFRHTFRAPPFLFRRMLRLFSTMAKLRFAQERGV